MLTLGNVALQSAVLAAYLIGSTASRSGEIDFAASANAVQLQYETYYLERFGEYAEPCSEHGKLGPCEQMSVQQTQMTADRAWERCAAFVLHLDTLLEDHGTLGLAPPGTLSELAEVVLTGKSACHDGRVDEAIEIFSRVPLGRINQDDIPIVSGGLAQRSR